MNERIKELMKEANKDITLGKPFWPALEEFSEKFAELIVAECMEQVEQAKNSPFVSLDDAKRMSHFVDVTTKKIRKHFGVEK
jgi:hypothetical protein